MEKIINKHSIHLTHATYSTHLLLILLIVSLYFTGCSSSKVEKTSEETESTNIEKTFEETTADKIILVAKYEQENKMYSPEVDSTFLYWLDSTLIILNGSTKCNIFALNVLYKAGFKTPDVNTLSRDLFDTTNFRDILPVIGINDIANAKRGDLVSWKTHVIIFEYPVIINNEQYAYGWWAGTRQEDNGDNIKNNVCHGKYKLDGEYVLRRPVHK